MQASIVKPTARPVRPLASDQISAAQNRVTRAP